MHRTAYFSGKQPFDFRPLDSLSARRVEAALRIFRELRTLRGFEFCYRIRHVEAAVALRDLQRANLIALRFRGATGAWVRVPERWEAA